jgi:hypothetical protein
MYLKCKEFRELGQQLLLTLTNDDNRNTDNNHHNDNPDRAVSTILFSKPGSTRSPRPPPPLVKSKSTTNVPQKDSPVSIALREAYSSKVIILSVFPVSC